MQRPLREQMLTAAQFVKRFKAEMDLQQRRYCQALALWRQCPVKRCRRDRTCRSDQPFCMVTAHFRWSAGAQQAVRQHILDATPANIGAPERAARELMPYQIRMADTTANEVAFYLSRANLSRTKREKFRVDRQAFIGAKRAREEP
jgi:hypothetical protein